MVAEVGRRGGSGSRPGGWRLRRRRAVLLLSESRVEGRHSVEIVSHFWAIAYVMPCSLLWTVPSG